MDRVRFGRVLGRGARLAARTVYEAVDAATSAPASTNRPEQSPAQFPPRAVRTGQDRSPGVTIQRPVSRSRPASAVRRAGAGTSLIAPVKRASRAVSLEITGSFFALFAVAFGVAAWRSRAAVSAAGPSLYRLLMYCAFALLFAYFATSNFMRARRLQ